VLQQEKPVEMAAIGVDRTAWEKRGGQQSRTLGKTTWYT